MSTKTTFKRVALVAVASLGFGVLTSVAPASAATALTAGSTGTGTSVSAAVAGKALRVGVESRISVTYTGPAITAYANDSGTSFTGGWASGNTVNPNMRVLSVPATSAVAITAASGSASVTAGTGLDINNYTDTPGGTSALPQQVGEGITLGAQVASAFAAIDFTPDKAGSYSFLFWDDVNRDGSLGGATEKYVIATFVVGNEIASLTASTTINNGTTIGTSYSSVVKVVAKDAAGNVTVPSGADSVTLTVTGAAKWKYSFGGPSNSVTEVSGSGTSIAYLTATDFNASGAAYIGLYNNTAETVSVTPGIIGSLTTPTVTTTTVTFKTPTTYIADNTSVAVAPLNTVTTKDTAGAYTVPLGSAAGLKITTAATGASAISQLGIVEVSGTAYGDANIIGVTTVTTVAAAVTTATAPYALGTLSYSSITPSATTANRSYKLVVGGTATTLPIVGTPTITTAGNAFSIFTTLNDSAVAGITVSPSAPTLATGATVNLTVTVVDSYDNARAGIAVTAAFSAGGRNSGKALASAITDADGIAKFSYVDTNASAVTTALSDVLTFTTTSPLGASVSSSGTTVSYVAGLVVSTVKMTTPNQTLGVAALAVTPNPITAGAAGPTAGAIAVTATVTTSTGAVLAGLPVTFSVSGTTAAVTSTTKTAYTSSTGVASASVYAWATGTYTITATAGGVSATGTITFTQEDAATARTVSAAAKGNVVTATVKDRFGNAVKGSTIYAKASGSGYFGNGLLSTSGSTDANGEVSFVVAGGSATVTVSNIDFAAVAGSQTGQTSAPKGFVVNATTNSATVGIFTASAAGTDTTIEAGVGASFDAAGVSSATVSVEIANTAADNAQAAQDAAAEATDAANAATDAANAAAEAADAATAAAQDAADAVAALSAQVATLISGLKAQLTALTNLIIKIQKKVKA